MEWCIIRSNRDSHLSCVHFAHRFVRLYYYYTPDKRIKRKMFSGRLVAFASNQIVPTFYAFPFYVPVIRRGFSQTRRRKTAPGECSNIPYCMSSLTSKYDRVECTSNSSEFLFALIEQFVRDDACDSNATISNRIGHEKRETIRRANM